METTVSPQITPSQVQPLAEYCLRLGDDRLILGHRLSEWCGHGPQLEEDIALANIALDNLGVANNFLTLAGELEGQGRDADALAFFRDETQFRNCHLVEQPNGDFAATIVRQLFFSAYSCLLFEKLQAAPYADLAGVSAKGAKEAAYHMRHSREWVLRLGGGTEESHDRAQRAVTALWRFTGELFVDDAIEAALNFVPQGAALHSAWVALVDPILHEANLVKPAEVWMAAGARRGAHSEHLGHLLAEMQSVARAHPGARW